jgi:undecaprenyl diphosphate synthase
MPRPRHIAIVMDGNGRWASERHRPRVFGHRAGVKAVRRTVEAVIARGIESLTLFAFSSENWSRPATEVNALMDLFLKAMRRETEELSKHGVRIRFIGDRVRFVPELREQMAACESMTLANSRLNLNIAVNYGGRLDIVQAARRLAERTAAGQLDPADIDEACFSAEIALAEQPAPDLFIRTGGEHRISNFLLWQIAYTELHFSPALWPDFDALRLDQALLDYASRERRFGKTPEQVRQQSTVA